MKPLDASTPAKRRRACKGCGTPISFKGRTGMCRSCVTVQFNADPEFQRKRAEGIRRKFRDDPQHVERMRRVISRNHAEALSRPEYREKLVERGRVLASTALRTPEALANLAAVRADNGKKVREAWLSWCPEEYRPLYYRLTRTKRMLRDEARAHVERQIEVDRFKAIADKHLPDILHHLRRLTAVHQTPDGWLYGTVKTDAAGLAERALQKGWQP